MKRSTFIISALFHVKTKSMRLKRFARYSLKERKKERKKGKKERKKEGKKERRKERRKEPKYTPRAKIDDGFILALR